MNETSYLNQINSIKYLWDIDRPRMMTIAEYAASDCARSVCRGGIIPYFLESLDFSKCKSPKIYFGLGLDAKYFQLSDFGGGIQKDDSDSIAGALREFEEETLNSFSIELSQTDWVLANHRILIIFKQIDSIQASCGTEKFYKMISSQVKADSPEMTEIIWLDSDEFFQLISNSTSKPKYSNSKEYPIYELVRSFLGAASFQMILSCLERNRKIKFVPC